MNKLQKIFLSAILCVTTAMGAQASGIDSVIKKSHINETSTIAVSVKDAKSGHTIYEYNEKKLMNPASVQKLLTMRTSYIELGKDYTFTTKTYADDKSNLYIKLSSDPTFTTGQLVALLKSFKEKYNKPINDVIIDPSITDNKQWGIGWMWDDDASAVLPKYSSFSINENKIEITLEPDKNSTMPKLKKQSSYPMTVINKVKSGDTNNLNIERQPWLSADMTTISGSLKSQAKIKLPVDNPEKYFVSELKSALSTAGIKTTGTIKVAPVSQNANLISEVSSENLSKIIEDTLKKSNNFNSEMIFRAAAAHKTGTTGTTENAVKMLEEYFSNIKNKDSHIIVDGCGISRNNLISADFVTSALSQIYKEKDFEEFSKLIAKPMEGTLSDRLLDISLKIRAKTGTASGISSIAGYIETKSGKSYTFAILIQNHNENTAKIKQFEDEIIHEIYKL